MGGFTAYYDTSGNKALPYIVTAGLLGSDRTWTKFERDWNRVLSDFNIPYVHMRELAGNSKPHFHKFKDDPERKARLFQRLIRVLGKHTVRVFTTALQVEAWLQIDREYRFSEIARSPFATVAGSCATAAAAWLARTHAGQRLEHFHEEGDHDWGTLNGTLNVEGIVVTPRSAFSASADQWLVPFQGADLLAWEVRRGEIDASNGRAFRRSIQAIMDRLGTRGEFRLIDIDVLRAVCRRYPQHHPRRS